MGRRAGPGDGEFPGPKQTEPPFVLTQLLVLALFAWLGFAAFRRFRPHAVVTAKQATAAAVAR